MQTHQYQYQCFVMPLPVPCPDLAALDLLVSVGALGSISAAARAHGVTQPAASMRLRDLEGALGVQLLQRTTTGARLTPGGLATAEWAAAILREMQTLVSGTAALRADRDSHLRLAASLTVAEYLLPRWLEQLAEVLPHIKVSLAMGNTEHVAELVERGEVELGFIEGPRPLGRLRAREVAVDELLVVVGSGHPWCRRGRPLSPVELAATPLLLREPGSGTRDVLSEALGVHGLGVIAAMELASTTAIKTAVMGGANPAVLSALAVAGELRAGRLVSIPCDGLGLRRVIRAVWAEERSRSVTAGRLVTIAESFAPTAGTG